MHFRHINLANLTGSAANMANDESRRLNRIFKRRQVVA